MTLMELAFLPSRLAQTSKLPFGVTGGLRPVAENRPWQRRRQIHRRPINGILSRCYASCPSSACSPSLNDRGRMSLERSFLTP